MNANPATYLKAIRNTVDSNYESISNRLVASTTRALKELDRVSKLKISGTHEPPSFRQSKTTAMLLGFTLSSKRMQVKSFP